MTDVVLMQYILNFTFLIHDKKAIGAVLDMNHEPHVFVLEEFRGNGYGSRLLKKYILENELVGSNKYVYHNAGTDAGEKLIKRFSEQNHEFKVIKVDEEKYIILKDYRL